jgi:hypothetical protein
MRTHSNSGGPSGFHFVERFGKALRRKSGAALLQRGEIPESRGAAQKTCAV